MSDERLPRIEDKIDKITEHIASIDVTLGKQHVSLEHHIKRTNLLEARLAPIETHVSMVNGAIKLIATLAFIATIIEVFMRLKL